MIVLIPFSLLILVAVQSTNLDFVKGILKFNPDLSILDKYEMSHMFPSTKKNSNPLFHSEGCTPSVLAKNLGLRIILYQIHDHKLKIGDNSSDEGVPVSPRNSQTSLINYGVKDSRYGYL
jgi:hypothetical protein